MRKHKFTAISLAAAITILLLFSGCVSSPEQEKYYYTLDYAAQGEKPELIQSEALDADVWVRGALISRTYERKQIVVRHFGPRISYLENHLWANELEEKIPELILARLNAYNLFDSSRSDFPYTRPDYELLPTVIALEFIRGEGNPRAAVHLRFDLRELEGNSMVSTEIQKEIPVYHDSIDSFVQVVNETILEYTDLFVQDVLASFGREGPRAAQTAGQIEALEEDDKEGYGQLLMPGFFENREAQAYRVIGQEGSELYGTFGTPLDLKAGRYTLRYGSGNTKQKMVKTVDIREGYRTIIDPNYGGLAVEILTPNGRPVDLSYEVFDASTGNSYGTGYSSEGVSELEGQIWILPVGRYKVIINNLPFSSNRGFSSVYVEKGKGNILTLTVEEIESSNQYQLVGGGVIKEPLYMDEQHDWLLNTSIAGNVSGTLNNAGTFEDYVAGLNFNGFLQNRLRYDYGRLNFTLLNLIEAGATRSETGPFEINRDTVEVDSTLVFNLLYNLGLYLNMDVSSHFLDSYYRSADDFDYRMLDPQGSLIEQGSGVQTVKTSTPFLPVEFQEGTGLNLELFTQPLLEASTRFGLGFRQTLYGDSYPTVDSTGDPLILQQKENEYTTGLEASLQLTTQLPQGITYSTRFDAYAPFTDLEDLSLEWVHDLQLALAGNLTIDYRATVYNTTDPDGAAFIASDHGVYLRFSAISRLSF